MYNIEKIHTTKIKNGMILASDIIKNDNIVLQKNTILTNNIIKKLDENYVNIKKDFTIENTLIKFDITKIQLMLQDFIINRMSPERPYIIANEIIKCIESEDNGINLLKTIHSFQTSEDIVFKHSLNVAVLSYIIAKWSSLKEDLLPDLIVASLFHDIGKMLINIDVLNKTDVLSNNEMAQVKNHTVDGYKKIKNSNLNPKVINAVLMHHERNDGSGYPLNIDGDKIEEFAKIIAIADTYDAMTSDRNYRQSYNPFEVIKYFEKNLTKYDFKYLIPFINNILYMYVDNQILINNIYVGKIFKINQYNLSNPFIKKGEQIIDLSLNEYKITKVFLGHCIGDIYG